MSSGDNRQIPSGERDRSNFSSLTDLAVASSSRCGDLQQFVGVTLCNMELRYPNPESAAQAAQALRLVPDSSQTPASCSKCGAITRVGLDSASRFGFRYWCTNTDINKRRRNWRTGRPKKVSACNGSISPATNTFFDNVKASTIQVLQLMYCWAINLPVKFVASEVNVSQTTAVDFYSFCREVAEVVVSNMPLKIGGPGLHVDETYTRRRKYNRGRQTSGNRIVIFGAYCRETKEGMFWHVPDKTRRVLWSHMERYIERGSIILSDAAPQYQGCEVMGFAQHKVITHSRQGEGRFVDPRDKQTHTQNIEIRNRYVKATIKSLRSDRTIQQYMCEYTYRNRVLSVLDENWQRFVRFAHDVATVYPGPGREGLAMQIIGITTDVTPEEPFFDVCTEETESESGDETVQETRTEA